MTKKLFFQALLLMLVFLSSISGVFTTWHFAEEPATDSNSSFNVNINEFVWTPEEILPTVTPGQNFLDLYESILNNSKAGLNLPESIPKFSREMKATLPLRRSTALILS